MGQKKPISFKVEPEKARQLEEEAEKEGKSKSQYIREIVANRHRSDEEVEQLRDKVSTHQEEIHDLKAKLDSKRDEVTSLEDKLAKAEETLRTRNARLSNLQEIKETQQRIEAHLSKNVEENAHQLSELAEDVDAIEGKMHTLRKRQGVFLDEAQSFFEDMDDEIHRLALNIEGARGYMQKVWEEFRRYHKQDFRARALRRLGLVPSRHDLPEEDPELSDNPAEEH